MTVWQHIAKQMLREFHDANKGDCIDVTFEVIEDTHPELEQP